MSLSSGNGTTESNNRRSLKRDLGLLGAGAFVVTNMIGTGIFTVPAFVRASTGGGLSSLSVWAAGAFLALCGAFCYAELATRMPRAGGEYFFLARVYGPLWGFLSGWVSFLVGFSAASAAAAIGASAYAARVFPGWNPDAPMLQGVGVSQGAALAAALVLSLGLFHSLGIRPGSTLQGLLASVTLGSVFVFIFAGLGSGRGDWGGLIATSDTTGSWWVALIQVSFAYSGWNAASYLAGEVKQPGRTLPRALLGGTLVVALTYLAINVLFLFAIPVNSWQREIAVAQQAAVLLFGDSGAQMLSILITITIVGSLSAMTAAGPRVYFAMAQDRLAPALFARLGPRGGAPALAIMAQSTVAATMALTGAFETLLIYVGSVLLLFNGLAVAAVFVVRRSGPPAPGEFRVPGFPVTPILFLAAVVLAWGYGLLMSPQPTGAALLTVIGGMIVYRIGSKRGWLTYTPEDIEGKEVAPSGPRVTPSTQTSDVE